MKKRIWPAAAAGLLLLTAGCGPAPSGKGALDHGGSQTGTTAQSLNTGNQNTANTAGNSNSGILGSSLPNAGSSYSNSGAAGQGAAGGLRAQAYHRNTRMEMSPYLAAQIAAIPEVDRALAVVTDTNVYVAVQLKDVPQLHNISGSRGGSGSNAAVQNGAGGSAGPGSGIPATEDPNMRRDTISGITGNSYDHYNRGSFRPMSDNGVEAGLRTRIVERVHALSSPALQHVFVSADPVLYRRFEGFASEESQRKSLIPVLEEFNGLAASYFPTADGTGSYGGSAASGDTSRKIGNTNGDLRGRAGGAKER